MRAKHFIVFFVFACLFFLHMLPAILIVRWHAANEWLWVYLFLFIIDMGWGCLLDEHWRQIYDN